MADDAEQRLRDDNGPRVTSVVAAMAILRHLGELSSGAGVNAVARALGLSPSSCFNVLKTLAAERFVDFDPVAKTYVLGPGCVAVARRALDPTGAFAAARAEMERLADGFQLTAALWRVRRAERLILLGFAETEAATRIHLATGQRIPLFAGAGGRCAAAWGGLREDEVVRRIGEVDWACAPSAGDYLAELETTRARGWALDEDRFMRGVTTFAAPVRDEAGDLAYCVTATMFSGQHDRSRFEAIGEATAQAAQRVTERLFGQPAQ